MNPKLRDARITIGNLMSSLMSRSHLMSPPLVWLPALRRYFGVVVAANLAWEVAQLPLYTLWKTGSANQITFAVLHCTGGDTLIAGATLVGCLLLFGAPEWPNASFLPVAAATLVFGLATTAWSEHVNTQRGAWTYSDLMPVLPGTGLGLAPLAQWVIIPILALATSSSKLCARRPDLPIATIPMSKTAPDQVSRSDRKPS